MENNYSDVPEDVKRFCQEYVVDLNVQKAMRRSNFNEYYTKGGYWLEKPEVQAYVKYLQSNISLSTGITAIKNAIELSKIAYPSIDENGNEVYEAKPSDRIKSIEILNKMLGFNEPEKSTVTVDNISKLSDEEIAAMIEAKRLQRQSLSE